MATFSHFYIALCNPRLLRATGWFILATFLALSYLQFDTGLADNGDFMRIVQVFSSGPEGFSTPWPDATSDESKYRFTNYWLPFWKLSFSPHWNKWFSSVWLIWIPGIIANCIVFSRTTLFLPMISLLPRTLSIILVWKLLKYLDSKCSLPIVLYLSLLVPLSLILINTDYVAYFNSFYQETASIVFLFLTLFSLNVYKRNSNSTYSILLLAFSAFCLTTAKLSCSYVPIVILPFVLWKHLLNNAYLSRYLTVILLVVIVPLLCTLVLLLTNAAKSYNAYNRLFQGALAFSERPESRLIDLGMEDGAKFINTSPWTEEASAFIERHKSKMTSLSFFRVVMAEPKILFRMMVYASNYTQHTATGLGTLRRGSANISTAWILTFWSKIKQAFFPRGLSFFIFLGFAGSAFWFNARSDFDLISTFSYSGLFCVVVCLMEMVVAILGEGIADLGKHLLLSTLSFDIVFLLFLNVLILLVIGKLCSNNKGVSLAIEQPRLLR